MIPPAEYVPPTSFDAYVPASIYARRRKLSERRVNQLLREGRIPGSKQLGGRWFVPFDAFTAPPPGK